MIASIRDDNVANRVRHKASWIHKLAFAFAIWSKGPHEGLPQRQYVDRIQPKIHNEDLFAVTMQESAFRALLVADDVHKLDSPLNFVRFNVQDQDIGLPWGRGIRGVVGVDVGIDGDQVAPTVGGEAIDTA